MSRPYRGKPRTILFIGISGSGKGTQAARLVRALRPSLHIEVGKVLRRYMRSPTPVWRFIRAVMERGDLAPQWAAPLVWLPELAQHLTANDHVIFDGSPRTVRDARMIDEVMTDLRRPLPLAVYLALGGRGAMQRLRARGRVDDTLVAIRRRFRFFRRNVLPVVVYYRRRGRLITINGDQPIPAVWRDIRKALHLA